MEAVGGPREGGAAGGEQAGPGLVEQIAVTLKGLNRFMKSLSQ